MSSPVKELVNATRTPLRHDEHLLNWVEKIGGITKPTAIHWVDLAPVEEILKR